MKCCCDCAIRLNVKMKLNGIDTLPTSILVKLPLFSAGWSNFTVASLA